MRFEDFTAAWLPALLKYATVLCGDRAEADDVVQEALTRALVKWSRIGRLEEPYAYVRVMVTNEWITVLGRDPVPVEPVPVTTLLDVAADVRLTAPHEVLVPMHFPAIPGHLPITTTDVDEHDAVANAPQSATLGFGGHPSRPGRPSCRTANRSPG